MTNIKINEERISVKKIYVDQFTDLLKDIKHCSNLLSQACDRSLHQCNKMLEEDIKELLE